MVSVLHTCDIHIRNTTRHSEYRYIFDILYKKAKELKPDVIFIGGDIGHTKTNISPEYVELATELFKNLADISHTIIILGNHDKAYKNNNRLDAVSPIVKALNHPNLHLYTKSGEYPFNENVTFNVMNTFDQENWTPITDNNKINIALYHGSISGCDTDIGWTMTNGENNISIFKDFDYVMLGDIHKTNQMLDNEGRARYAGSLIQQNFGETDDKGFLLWSIESKEKFSVKHFPIQNPKPFTTIEIDSNGNVPDVEVKPSSRMKVVFNNNFSLDIRRKITEIVRSRYKPEHLITNDKSQQNKSIVDFIGQFKKEDLRDIEVQEKLIKEYLKDFKLSKEKLQNVFNLNNKYNALVSNDVVARNIDFKIVKYEWNNFFKYGKGNSIDFSKLDGVIGLLGKNFSGKSSAVDSLLYILYNGITKKQKKSVNIINLDSNEGYGRVWLEIGKRTYRIERRSEKYLKKLNGNETIEAKTAVNFEEIDPITNEVIEPLNDIDRNKTDKNITKLFGSIDDFLLTSMTSQLGSLSYIDKGSTDRKEILAKFLDLDFFAEKFELANKDVADIKSSIKKFDKRFFDKEKEEIGLTLSSNKTIIDNVNKECNKINNNIESIEKDITVLGENLKQLNINHIKIDEVLLNKTSKNNEIKETKTEIKEIENKIKYNEEKIEKVNGFIENYNISSINDIQCNISDFDKQLDKLIVEINDNKKTLQNDEKKIDLLKQVPCGTEFSHCKFIKGAYEAQNNINIVKIVLENKEKEQKTLENTLKELEPKKINEQIEKYNNLCSKKVTLIQELEKNNLRLSAKTSHLVILQHNLNELDKMEQEYNENKEKIASLDEVFDKKNEKEQELKLLKEQYGICNKKLMEYHKNDGSFEQKLQKIEEDEQECNSLNKEYEAYDLFLKCFHSNGISYDIIKKSLPIINTEIAKNLSNIVDFDVFFQNEENRLELYIKEPNFKEALPIDLGSVAQKMLAAMAIRLAFIKVSSLPKSDIFILDEPGTSLDEENMAGFLGMLDVIKSHFKCVLLISHIEALKDGADSVINIENKNGYAFINV